MKFVSLYPLGIALELFFSLSLAQAQSQCEILYPIDRQLGDPFSEIRTYCRWVESSSEAVAALPIQEILSRARDNQCTSYVEVESFFFSTLCRAAQFAFQDRGCSNLSLDQVPELEKVPQHQEHLWESALVGICRGVELSRTHSSDIFRPKKNWDLPISIQTFSSLKRKDGYIPYFESSVWTRSLPDYSDSDSFDLFKGLENFVKKTISLASNPIQFVKTPPTGSGDDSYFVVDDNQNTIGFVKIYRTKTNFIDALTTEKILDSLNLKHSSHAKILGFGQIRDSKGKSFPIHLEEYIPGKTLLDWIRDFVKETICINTLKNAIQALAIAVSEVHSIPSQEMVSSDRLQYYPKGLRYWTEYLEEAFKLNPQITPRFEWSQMRRYNEDIIRNCSQSVFKKGAITLGDAALVSNVIYNPNESLLTFIDTQQINRSFNSKNMAHSHVVWDLSDILNNLNHTLQSLGVSSDDIQTLLEVFKSNYKMEGKPFSYFKDDPCFQMRNWHWKIEHLGSFLSVLENPKYTKAKKNYSHLAKQILADIEKELGVD